MGHKANLTIQSSVVGTSFKLKDNMYYVIIKVILLIKSGAIIMQSTKISLIT